MSNTLSASSDNMPSGAHVVLSWEPDPDSTVALASVFDLTTGAVVVYLQPSPGSVVVSPTVTTTYSLTSSLNSGITSTTNNAVTITVSSPPAMNLAAAEFLTVNAACSANVPTGSGPSPPSPPPPPPPPPALASLFLTRDAHRRPLAAGTGTAATGYYSNDAGHSFAAGVIDADATGADISLLVDRHTSRFSAFYTKGKPGSQALYAAFGPVVDGFPLDAPPAAANGIGGLFPIACEHPAERGAALLLLVSGGSPAAGVGGSLVCAETGDYGETWTPAGTVAASVDFSQSGRAGLCFVGDTAFAVYASGQGLACAKSVDRGHTWTPCAAAGTSGPYSGLSLLGWMGTLYLLAFAPPPAAGEAPVPVLFVSGELGQAWTVSAAPLPKIVVPSALGVLPETGQLRLGLTHHSGDDAATWLAD